MGSNDGYMCPDHLSWYWPALLAESGFSDRELISHTRFNLECKDWSYAYFFACEWQSLDTDAYYSIYDQTVLQLSPFSSPSNTLYILGGGSRSACLAMLTLLIAGGAIPQKAPFVLSIYSVPCLDSKKWSHALSILGDAASFEKIFDQDIELWRACVGSGNKSHEFILGKTRDANSLAEKPFLAIWTGAGVSKRHRSDLVKLNQDVGEKIMIAGGRCLWNSYDSHATDCNSDEFPKTTTDKIDLSQREIEKLLEFSNPIVRAGAIRCLPGVSVPAVFVINAVKKGLLDEDPLVKDSAAKVLIETIRHDGLDAHNLLRQLRAAESPVLRTWWVRSLGLCVKDRNTELDDILAASFDQHPMVRCEAVNSLVEFATEHPEEVKRRLHRMAEDESPIVKLAASLTLYDSFDDPIRLPKAIVSALLVESTTSADVTSFVESIFVSHDEKLRVTTQEVIGEMEDGRLRRKINKKFENISFSKSL